MAKEILTTIRCNSLFVTRDQKFHKQDASSDQLEKLLYLSMHRDSKEEILKSAK